MIIFNKKNKGPARTCFRGGFTQLVDFGFVFEKTVTLIFNLIVKINTNIGLPINKSKTFSKPKFTTGFTLLEALVAVSILMVAVVAPITIAQKGLSSAIYTKNQMIASYLAQDAIEYVKNKRDEYSINHLDSGSRPDWGGLTIFGPCLVDNLDQLKEINVFGCQIDTIIQKDTDITVSPYSNSNKLKKNDDGFYQYTSTDDDTNFTRQVKITLDPFGTNADEAMVNTIVKWEGDDNNKVNISTLIYNY